MLSRERFYETRRLRWLDDLSRDLRQTGRSFLKNPGFAATAILTLALGIGATTAIFTVVHAVVLKPLPYHDANRIVRLIMNIPAAESPSKRPLRTRPLGGLGVTYREARVIHERTRTLLHVGLMSPTLRAWPGQEESARIPGWRLSVAVLDMLRVDPMLGRSFSRQDEQPGGEPVILLSHSAWHRFFSGDAGAIGRSVTLDNVLPPRVQTRFTVIGVMPQGFVFPEPDAQFWIPFQEFGPKGNPLAGQLVAQLRDDTSAEAANADVDAILHDLRPHAPQTTYELVRERDELTAEIRPALLVLTLSVGLVLLIACVNVSNLLLARASAKQRELAIRVAIGAGRGRLIRQTLAESGLLAIFATVLGVGLAVAGTRLLQVIARAPSRIDLANGLVFPRLDEIGVDGTVLAFAALAAATVAMLCGLVPALRYSWCNPVDAFRGSSDRTQSAGRSMSSVLVISEIACAIVLLIATGVLVRSFLSLSNVNPGYDPSHVLTFQVNLPIGTYSDAQVRRFADDLTERLRAVPAVRAAAYANQLPMVNLRNTAGDIARAPDPTQAPSPMAPDMRLVSRDYFRTMGIRVLSGRGFTDADRDGADRVLVINQSLATRVFGNESPLNQFAYLGRDVIPWQIIGIVEDVRQFALDQNPTPQVFADLRQWSSPTVPVFPGGAYYVVRTIGDPSALVSTVRGVVNQLDASAAMFGVSTMEDLVAATVARPRMYAVILMTFSGIGLLLAITGVYGVLAYSITQRTREIGIRISLGAERGHVIKMVLSQSVMWTVVGIALGLVGSVAASDLLEGLVFGVTPIDQPTFIGIPILFLIIALVAAFIPARRASRVDPLTALRYE